MTGDDPAARLGRRAIGELCRRSLHRHATVAIEGIEHLPATGPTLLAARHVHHLYDGCLLWTALPRPFRPLVAVDWAERGPTRRLLDWACQTMGWPTILRPDTPSGASPEAARLLRQATKETVALLRAGEMVLVFPEGYPAVDPHPSPASRRGLDRMLPFRPGFARLAAIAELDGRTRVAVLPVGFAYAPGPPWRVACRLGPPLSLAEGERPEAFAARVETQARALSGVPARGPFPQNRR